MRGALVLSGFLALLSCAGRGNIPSAAAPLPSIASSPAPAQVLQLIGRFGIAHACPVEALDETHPHIITAAHVASALPRDSMQQTPLSYAFQQGTKTGVVVASPSHPPSWSVDLAWLDVVRGEAPQYNRVADSVNVGDEVSWYEYDYSSQVSMLQVKQRDSVVVQVLAGHLVTEESPARGASGGCIFNGSGEVVGVVAFGLKVEDDYGQFFGQTRPRWSGVGVVYTRDQNW